MVLLKYALLAIGFGLVLAAGAPFVWKAIREIWRRRRLAGGPPDVGPMRPLPVRRLARMAALGFGFVLAGTSLVVVPNGMAGVRVSQLSGTRPGALLPGVHFVLPFVQEIALYDVREHVLVADGGEGAKGGREPLRAQSKEGLAVGLAVSVRYRLDPARLDYIHANLPPSLAREVVPPVVASVYRQLIPNYMVRDVFATKREEIRTKAEAVIVEKLAADAIIVKEVMLSDIVLPAEYAKGLEGLLLKQQQNERMVYDLEIKEKEVKQAELEAEAQKTREVKAAEAQAQVRVLQAKGEADAMQHTLPLKEKQIEQTRLEAQARKEATLKNAEASAEAKVIESKADVERSNLMAGAEAHRIRITSAAESERMKLESDVLRENPLLIQKIVAERLSDKMQIMMVPMDGRNFFANEVFKSTMLPVPPAAASAEPQETSGRKVARKQ
jgi:regulator of protease activity HflC (stomatin/prohibitin superfamily)